MFCFDFWSDILLYFLGSVHSVMIEFVQDFEGSDDDDNYDKGENQI